MKAVEPVDCGLEVGFVTRDLELLDQVRRPGEENLPSCVCDLGLAGPLQILQAVTTHGSVARFSRPYEIRMARMSLTLVNVGPVRMRSPMQSKKV